MIIKGIRELPKPVVAAVNGPAVGIGCSLALACDLILAAESAFFGLAFVNIGLMPDGGSTLFVPAAVGKARALEMALLGEPVPARQALEWGLVNRVLPDDQLMDEAERWSPSSPTGPTRSYAGSKRALNRMLYPDLDGQLDLEAEIKARPGPDRRLHRGRSAFVQKRGAAFQAAGAGHGHADAAACSTARHVAFALIALAAICLLLLAFAPTAMGDALTPESGGGLGRTPRTSTPSTRSRSTSPS